MEIRMKNKQSLPLLIIELLLILSMIVFAQLGNSQ